MFSARKMHAVDLSRQRTRWPDKASTGGGMEAESIEGFIKNLGKTDFDAVSALLLAKVFNLTAINVDGKGDGGSDWRVFRDQGGSTTAAYQQTVQDARWKIKAIEDARKAVKELGATRYFFLTSRSRESAELVDTANTIVSELKIPATCLGARELAELVVGRGLIAEFFDAIKAPVNIVTSARPDVREVLLHSYVSLGSATADLRNDVYDDTLMFSLHIAEQPPARQQLVALAIQLLGCPEARREHVNRRVDSLLTRGWIKPGPEGRLLLATAKEAEVSAAERLYFAELSSLAASQAHLLHTKFGKAWSEDDAKRAGLFLARLFIQKQLETARHASLELTSLGLFHNLGDPDQDLRDLLARVGLAPRQVQEAVSEFVDVAKDRPLIKKLARAATYVAIEGLSPLSAAKVLGARNWNEVTVTLDASVSIPYICARLYSPTSERFSQGAVECVKSFRSLGAKLVTPWFYLEECASHLLKALDYKFGTEEFQEDYAHSRNGYVAQYYQLRLAGERVPPSIKEFVLTFATSAGRSADNRPFLIRRVMDELQPVFRDYGVEFEFVKSIPAHFRKDVELEYDFALHQLGRTKSPILVEHDVLQLSHCRRQLAEGESARVCLTWDGAMIGVGRKLLDCGWVVSPHEAADFVQPYLRLDESKMLALAYALASVREKPKEVAGRILDRVVKLASERLQDWEFREKVKALRQRVLDRIDLDNPRYADWIDQETDRFLQNEGVAMPSGLQNTEDTERD
jgi:hypothetical protein